MVGLAFAAVPLYKIFCQKTGYGGTTQVARSMGGLSVHNREVVVKLDTTCHKDLPWEFKPHQDSVKVRVGEEGFALYRVKNKTDKPITGIAAYNVIPDKAGIYFMKVECFCFIDQTLQPGEEVDMPLLFYIDPKIMQDEYARDVKTITLSYVFYPKDKFMED